MHIETLKAFCDLVDTGTFVEAARRNFVSQSAISQQLKALEARYGRRLIERGGGRGLETTDAGRVLYTECRALLDRFAAMEGRLREPSDAIVGSVRIATVYSVGLHALPPFVAAFLKAYPQVNVHVEYSRTDKVCEACAQNVLDFGIVAFPVRRAHLTVLPWRRERLKLVCAPHHRLARTRRVDVSQLDGERFIAFERDIPTRKTVDRLRVSRNRSSLTYSGRGIPSPPHRAGARRGPRPDGVARRSNIPDILPPHALPAGRRAPDYRHRTSVPGH